MGLLFWTSSDICPGFQSQDGFPSLHASLSVCNRFNSGVTPADLLVASMAAQPFHPCTCIQALVGLDPGWDVPLASEHVTRHTLFQLSYADWLQHCPPWEQIGGDSLPEVRVLTSN